MSQTSAYTKSRKKFNARLEKEVYKHREKLYDGRLSLPSAVGKLVITVSNRTYEGGDYDPWTQREAFHAEADQIAELRKDRYSDVLIRRAMVSRKVDEDLGDKEVSDMIFIGHGSIANVWMDEGPVINWRKVAAKTRYLKQGSIEQRMCGNVSFYNSVPLGTFALADQRRLIAPLGVEIDDVSPDELLFVPVYDKPVNSTNDIKSLIDEYI